MIPVFDRQPTRLQLLETFSKEYPRIYVLTEPRTRIATNLDISKNYPGIRWLEYKLSSYDEVKFITNFFIRTTKYYDFTKLGPSSISLFQYLNGAGVLYKKDPYLYKNIDWHSYVSKEELDLAESYL